MAARGPLPTGTAIRRNKPTIPTTNLPAAGRQDPAPDVPPNYELGSAGLTWWEWAWHTPQAANWDDGALFTVARRAQLEDDMAALDADVDLVEVFGLEPNDAAEAVGLVIGKLKALAGGKGSLLSKVNDLDDRLGLSPKAVAALRLKITGDTEEAPKAEPGKGRRLTAV